MVHALRRFLLDLQIDIFVADKLIELVGYICVMGVP